MANPMKVNERVQITNLKRPNVTEEKRDLQTVSEKLKDDHSDWSLVVYRVKGNDSSEHRTGFGHEIESIK
ncbi:unnamed protein product [Schistosoma curassoni]|uniref:YolD-like family protein n=1 Tax=Schistosoma curassoni TaxID=6186 RepID=A0A183K1P3_9TREM|nr:unnamed protein product [Schistosoma curassoni]